MTFVHAGYVYMLQLQKTTRALMRFVILLLFMQFVTPAFAQVSTGENTVHEKNTYSNVHHESSIFLSVFLKENSEEKNETNDKSPVLTAELIDFSFLTTVLTQHHSRFDWDVSNLPLTHEPLFKLNCIFLI